MSARTFAVAMPKPVSRSDDAWNLRPYDVPWGPTYHAYKPGQLPGHDGVCLMLRSPTPVEQKRTTIACKHCRQRKAKCSGDRPACGRCADRGRKCVYPEPEERSVRSQPASRPQRPGPYLPLAHPSAASGRRDSSISLASSSGSSYGSAADDVHAKAEYDPQASPQLLLYDVRGEYAPGWDSDVHAGSSPADSGYASPPASTAYSDVEYDAAGMHYAYPSYLQDASSSSSPALPSSAMPSIYAPTPVRLPAAAVGAEYPTALAQVQVPADPAGYAYQDPSPVPAGACAAQPYAEPVVPVAAAADVPVSISADPADASLPPQPYYLAAPRDAEPASPACGSYEHAQAQCPSYPAEVQHQYPDVWYPAEDVYYVVDAAAAYGPEFSGQVLYVHPSSVYC